MNYRRVEIQTWIGASFSRLSAPPPNGRTLWLYFLCGPRTIAIPGVVLGREAVIADDLGWTLEGFREAFAEVFREGMAEADWKAGVVLLNRALIDGTGDPRASNTPQSPNVVKSWVKAFDNIPASPLKPEILRRLGAFTEGLGGGFAKAFQQAFAKALAHPSRIQEREVGSGKEEVSPSGGAGARDPSTPAPRTPPGPTNAEHACDRLNEARRELDPSAPPVDPFTDPAGARELYDRLKGYPPPIQRQKLDHALDVLIAKVKADGGPADDLRLGMLAGEKAWPRWVNGTVAGVSKPRSRGDPTSRPKTGLAATAEIVADRERPYVDPFKPRDRP